MIRRLLHHEGTIWSTGIVTTIAGHEAASEFVDWNLGRHAFPWIALGFFIFMTLAFYATYENPLPKKLDTTLRNKVAVWGAVPWLVGAIAFIFLFASAAELHEAFDGRARPRLLFAYGASFIAFIVIAYKIREQLMVVHSRYVGQEAMGDRTHGAKHLVLLVSEVDVTNPPEMHWSGSLAADLDELRRLKEAGILRWKWEMPLRALEPHRKTLESLTLICSEESIKRSKDLEARVKTYPEFENVEIRVWCEREGIRTLVAPGLAIDCPGFEFNRIDVLSSALVDLLKYLRFVTKRKPHDIMIDYTGGQKPTSVAAVAVTLRGELRAQYIDTNTLERFEVDLVTSPEPKAG